MSHYFLAPEAWGADGELVLTEDEARHCRSVRRQEVGDEIGIMDGQGRVAVARIELLEKHRVVCKASEIKLVAPPVSSLTLIQAIPKGDSLEWIMEKAVELGVTKIVPVTSERTIVRLKDDELKKKHLKWQRYALEASKQCGQAWLPVVVEPMPLMAALADATDIPCRLVASLEAGAEPLNKIVTTAQTGAALAIGPEGDFTPSEYRAFAAAGWQALCLGSLTLRCETAAIAGLSVLQYHLASLRS